MTKNFPKTLFVKKEKDSDTEYFVADDEATCLLENGERTVVATYKLVEVSTGSLLAEFTPLRRSR